MVMGCGPFDMLPREVDTFYIAVMFSNGNTGGFDYLKQETELAHLIGNGPHEVEVLKPGNDTIFAQYEVKWQAQSATANSLSIDLYLTPDRDTSYPGKAIYTYDVWDITLNTPVILGHSFMVSLDSSLCVDYSPMFDGVSLRTEVVIDNTTFSSDSIKVTQGVYADSAGLEASRIFVPAPHVDSFYTTLEPKIGAFRGIGTIKLQWKYLHGNPDTLTLEVWDMINDVEIPFDSTLGTGWCFRVPPAIYPFFKPRSWITEIKRPSVLYVAGAKYYPNGGGRMTVDGFNSIQQGDVWVPPGGAATSLRS